MQILHAQQALTATGWQDDITISIGSDGRIAAIGPTDQPPDTRVDLVLPAPVNLHSHSFQRAMAGLTERRGDDPTDSFWTWRKLMYRFLDQLTPDHVEAIAAMVFVEMLEAGYGAVGEFHYLHHGPGGVAYDNPAELAARVAAAAQRAGIGLTLLPVLYHQGGCDGRALGGGQRRFGNGSEAYASLHNASARIIADGPSDWAIGVAPHSLRAVSPAALNDVIEMGANGPIHMHLAEQIAEVEDVQAHLGARPAEWLLSSHDVDDRWCLIHATQMTLQETSDLAKSGAVVGLCPITESNLGDGIFNGTAYLSKGGSFGVGSDSNVHIGLFEELATLEYSQRLRDRSRAALALPGKSVGRTLFDHVAKGGSQAAGRCSGSLAVGQLADIVGLSTNNPWVCARRGDMVLDSLIFAGHGRDCITDVWSAGRHVVQDGRHLKRDAVERAFMATMADLDGDL